jgi:AcrR family transcriptional regulator
MRAEKQKSEIRQEQIAQATMALIAEQGLKGVSVASVARRVGLVPSALYRHFKGKEEILEATIGLIRERLLEIIRMIREQTPFPLEQLHLLMEHHIRMIQEFQVIPRIILSDEMLSTPLGKKSTSYKFIGHYLDQVAEIVAEGQRRLEIDPGLNPQTVSVIFLGLIQPPVILWTLSKGKFPLSRHMKKAWEFFYQTVVAQNPKARSSRRKATGAKKNNFK